MGNRDDLAVYQREYERAEKAVKDWQEMMEVTQKKIDDEEKAHLISTAVRTERKKT